VRAGDHQLEPGGRECPVLDEGEVQTAGARDGKGDESAADTTRVLDVQMLLEATSAVAASWFRWRWK
jgi:hypothetical protein